MSFFFFSRKAFTLRAMIPSLAPSRTLPLCILWYIWAEGVWVMLSGWLGNRPAVDRSRSHSAGAARSPEAGKHWFPSGLSGDLCFLAPVEPALQTDTAAASRSFSSCWQPCFQNKVTPEGSFLLSRCLHTAVSSFESVFFCLTQGQNSFSLAKWKSKQGMFFPYRSHSYRAVFFYRIYRSCSWLFLLRS